MIHGAPKCKHILALAIVLAIQKDKEKASVEVTARTEASSVAAQGGNSRSSNDSTPRQDGQGNRDAISNPQTYEDHVRRHNYVSSFTGYCQAHTEYRMRRWGKQ